MELLSAFENILFDPWTTGLILPLAVFLLFFFTRGPLTGLLFSPLEALARRTGSKWPAELVRAFRTPVRALLIAAGLLIALRISPAVSHTGEFWLTTVKCFRSLLVVLLSWGLFRLSDRQELASVLLVKKLDLQVDEALLPFLSKVLRFLVLAVAALVIAQEWNYSISGLLTGLGLGGLAFALAAKDMLSNLFGGLVIFLDKPFTLGDWIKTGEIEGTVEDINFRSVKIRTFAQALVTVPNSRLTEGAVVNFSRMGKRRGDFSVTLKPGTTAAQMKACTEKIRAALLQNPDIEPESAAAAFEGIGESGLSLMLSFYTRTTDWKEYLRVRENMYYDVLSILEQEGVEIAFRQAEPGR